MSFEAVLAGSDSSDSPNGLAPPLWSCGSEGAQEVIRWRASGWPRSAPRRLAQAPVDVGVEVGGDGDLGVAEAFGDDLEVDPARRGRGWRWCGEGRAAGWREAGSGGEGLEVAGGVFGPQGRAVLAGEDQPAVRARLLPKRRARRPDGPGGCGGVWRSPGQWARAVHRAWSWECRRRLCRVTSVICCTDVQGLHRRGRRPPSAARSPRRGASR